MTFVYWENDVNGNFTGLSEPHSLTPFRESQPCCGINTARRNINNLRNAHDTALMAESKEELKSPLMRVKEESEKLA